MKLISVSLALKGGFLESKAEKRENPRGFSLIACKNYIDGSDIYASKDDVFSVWEGRFLSLVKKIQTLVFFAVY